LLPPTTSSTMSQGLILWRAEGSTSTFTPPVCFPVRNWDAWWVMARRGCDSVNLRSFWTVAVLIVRRRVSTLAAFSVVGGCGVLDCAKTGYDACGVSGGWDFRLTCQ